MVIEIVDEAAAILAFRETVESLVRGGLITVERVEIWAYRGAAEGEASARVKRVSCGGGRAVGWRPTYCCCG